MLRTSNFIGICALIFLCPVLLAACASNGNNVQEQPAFDPEAAFKEANDLMKEGYYEEARQALEEIRTRGTSVDSAVLARLRIADTYFEERSYEEAVAEYENFLESHPDHRYSPYAQYRIAMCFYERIKTVDVSYSFAKRALEEFRKLQRRYPRNPYMDITESRIRSCRRVLAGYEFYVGEFYFDKGSYGAAANRFRGLLEKYPETKMESDALYFLGLSYKEMGETDKAVDALKTLIEKYPHTDISSEARQVIASVNATEK